MLTRRRDVPYLGFRPDDDAPEASRHLEREGWALLPGVLDRDEIELLAAEITAVYDTLPADGRRPHREPAEQTQFRYEMLNRSAACQAVVGNRRILDVIEPLLGEDCHVIANTAWRNPASVEHTHGGGLWHIDAGPHIPLPPGVDWDERIPHPVFAIGCHILCRTARPSAGRPGSSPAATCRASHPPPTGSATTT